MRRFAWLLIPVVIIVVVAVVYSRRDSNMLPPIPDTDASAPIAGLPWFDDVTAASGIDFQHFVSPTPRHSIEETMGSGLAWIDYDGDGWPDLFCVQGGRRNASDGSQQPTHKLYRNNRDGTFTDVTKAVGLDKAGYGMGCAVGDFDNDGYDDLVVTYLTGVALFHNEPDGRGGRHFVDVTAASGIADPHWATSCGWADIDGDGLLDLYVCNYVELIPGQEPTCVNPDNGIYFTCSPTAYPHTTHKLFRNNGNGTFTDISVSSGIAAAPPAPGLGVVLCDLDGDGRIDIFVANDMRPSYLFHNLGGGRFAEKALFSGTAMGPGGAGLAGMGVDVADVDRSGRPSIFVTNYQNNPNVLFVNRGKLLFDELSYPSGLGMASLDRLGFGAVFLDADLDGIPDVAVANGHVQRDAAKLSTATFEQQAQFFRGLGAGKFEDHSPRAGAYFQRRLVGRGLAYADFNNDGLPDLAYSHSGGPLILLRNATKTANHWIRLELIGDGVKSNRNAIGARIEIEAGGIKQTQFISGGGSYLSASERRRLVGLGATAAADRVTVFWPSGRRQEFKNLSGDRSWRLHEGREQPEEYPASPPR